MIPLGKIIIEANRPVKNCKLLVNKVLFSSIINRGPNVFALWSYSIVFIVALLLMPKVEKNQVTKSQLKNWG